MYLQTLERKFTPKPVFSFEHFIEQFESWIRFGTKKSFLKYSFKDSYKKGTKLEPPNSADLLFRIFKNELIRDGQNIGKLGNLKRQFDAEYSEGRGVSVALPRRGKNFTDNLPRVLDLLKREFERMGLAQIWREGEEPISKEIFYCDILSLYCFEIARQGIIEETQRKDLLNKTLNYPD